MILGGCSGIRYLTSPLLGHCVCIKEWKLWKSQSLSQEAGVARENSPLLANYIHRNNVANCSAVILGARLNQLSLSPPPSLHSEKPLKNDPRSVPLHPSKRISPNKGQGDKRQSSFSQDSFQKHSLTFNFFKFSDPLTYIREVRL
jgi:hypothetical protein